MRGLQDWLQLLLEWLASFLPFLNYQAFTSVLRLPTLKQLHTINGRKFQVIKQVPRVVDNHTNTFDDEGSSWTQTTSCISEPSTPVHAYSAPESMLSPWISPQVLSYTWDTHALQLTFWDSHLDVTVNGHVLRLISKLGEGGYAFVYLAKELPSPQHKEVDTTTQYALKKVLAGTQEALDAAQREATIQQQASHPCILPLLDWAVVPPSAATNHTSHTVYLLSPAYPDGTLADELARLTTVKFRAISAETGKPFDALTSSFSGQEAAPCVLSTRQVLQIFRQLCLALDALHEQGYAHRDVKVHNMLIERPQLTGKHQQQLAIRKQAGSQYQSVSTVSDVESSSAMQSTSGQSEEYHVVLMDFGSAQPRVAEIKNRTDALRLQEDAEAHCTATYRCLELWDVPSPWTMDQAAADVWAAGCTLFASMYGTSPFQMALNQGGSIALAAMNGTIPWPKDVNGTYPAALHQLVISCLQADPATRPTAGTLAQHAAALLRLSYDDLPDPVDYAKYADVLHA